MVSQFLEPSSQTGIEKEMCKQLPNHWILAMRDISEQHDSTEEGMTFSGE